MKRHVLLWHPDRRYRSPLVLLALGEAESAGLARSALAAAVRALRLQHVQLEAIEVEVDGMAPHAGGSPLRSCSLRTRRIRTRGISLVPRLNPQRIACERRDVSCAASGVTHRSRSKPR